MTLEELVDQILNHIPEDTSGETCECQDCWKLQDKSKCETCGYEGRFDTLACTCYDTHCNGGKYAGVGCPHGARQCPLCHDGDEDGWHLINCLRESWVRIKEREALKKQKEETDRQHADDNCKGVGSATGPWCDRCAAQLG